MEMTLAQLVEAYKRGDKLEPMHLDNDSVNVYRVHDDDWINVDTVYEAHPEELLEEALTLLGIPWEHV